MSLNILDILYNITTTFILETGNSPLLLFSLLIPPKAPSNPTVIATPTPSNLLAVSVEPWQRLSDPGTMGPPLPLYVVATGADREIHLRHTAAENGDVVSLSGFSDSPILSYVSVSRGEYVFMTNMSGQLLLLRGSEILDKRKDHGKYVVKVVAHEQGQEKENSERKLWIATAGWDGKILIYCMDRFPAPAENEECYDQAVSMTIGDPVASITLPSNPESMLFVHHPTSGRLVLLASRRDSTYLHYFEVEPEPQQEQTQAGAQTGAQTDQGQDSRETMQKKPYECKLLGRQNLAPHSVAWLTFSPCCLALSPHDPGIIAVATSTTPHMKIMIVRLLFPSEEEGREKFTYPAIADDDGSPPPRTGVPSPAHISPAFSALTLQNREDAAILIQVNTFAPQTPYSTPQVVWRPDGSGLWVNGDDGVIRGVEAKTGKLIVTLKNGHQFGSKVRTLWAGWVDVPQDDRGEGTAMKREEWLVSGGFDKRLIVWRV